MEDLKRLAAIDIGSNAVRLLVNNVLVNGDVKFKKASLIRVPVRLGEDAFIRGRIGRENIDRLLKAMHAYKNLMDVYNVDAYKGCATSAMREADNGPHIVERIKQETGLSIEIISGQVEAEIIFSTQLANSLEHNQSYLYVDVGGGSTELTLFSNNKKIASESFIIGTIRILKKMDTEKEWNRMRKWLAEIDKSTKKKLTIIGSGGNINKIFKMSRNKIGKPLTLTYLSSMYKLIRSYSIHQRMTILDLNPDRADVIEPALHIFLYIMEHANINQVLVPKIGLSDGIIRTVHERYMQKQLL